MINFFKDNRFLILCIVVLTIVSIPFFSWSLWRDESFSVNLAMSDVSRIIDVISQDTQHPFHILFLHYWGKIFSYGEFSMRIISFVSMVLSIVVINKYSRYFFTEEKGNKNELYRKIFMILMVVNPMVMFYATEARPYALFFLFFNLSFWLFFRIYFLNERRLNNRLGFIVASILMLYTHTIAVVPVAVMGLFVVWKVFKEKVFSDIIPFVITGLAYLPWAYVVLKQLTQFGEEGFWYDFKPLYSTFEGITRLFIGSDLNSDMKLNHVYLMTFISSIGLGLLFWSIFRFIQNSNNFRSDRVKFVFGFTIVNLVVIWVLSFITPLFLARYLFFLIPFVLMIVTFGIRSLDSSRRYLGIVVAGVLVFSTIVFQVVSLYLQPYKADFESASEFIEDNYNEDSDVILAASVLNFHSPFYYLDSDIFLYDPNSETYFFEGRAILERGDYFSGNLEDYSTIWVISRLDMDRQLFKDLQELGFGIAEVKDFRKVEVQRWER